MSTLQHQIDNVKRSIETAKVYINELEVGLAKLENPPPFTVAELNYWENHWKNIKPPSHDTGISTTLISAHCTFLTHWCRIDDLVKGNRYYACIYDNNCQPVYRSFVYTVTKNKPVFTENGTKYLLTQSFDKHGHTELYISDMDGGNKLEIYLKWEAKQT